MVRLCGGFSYGNKTRQIWQRRLKRCLGPIHGSQRNSKWNGWRRVRATPGTGNWQASWHTGTADDLHNVDYARGHFAYGFAAEQDGNSADAGERVPPRKNCGAERTRICRSCSKIQQALAAHHNEIEKTVPATASMLDAVDVKYYSNGHRTSSRPSVFSLVFSVCK